MGVSFRFCALHVLMMSKKTLIRNAIFDWLCNLLLGDHLFSYISGIRNETYGFVQQMQTLCKQRRNTGKCSTWQWHCFELLLCVESAEMCIILAMIFMWS